MCTQPQPAKSSMPVPRSLGVEALKGESQPDSDHCQCTHTGYTIIVSSVE